MLLLYQKKGRVSMFKTLLERYGSMFSKWMNKSITAGQLARLCQVLLVVMLIPLILVALHNYPADDDFGFVLPVAAAWVETGSLWEVCKAIVQKTYDTYMTWQGYFVSTALFSVTPMVFDIGLYFLDNWLMLALLCLSVGYLVKSVTRLLQADRHVFWIVYTACLVLVLQFMPSIANSIYWHNGGQYTTAACTLAIMIGMFLRTAQKQPQCKAHVHAVLLSVCAFMLGGSFYGPALGAFVLLLLWTFWAWGTRSSNRWACTAALVFFLLSFAINVCSPGSALRQAQIGEPRSVGETLIVSILDSFDLAGSWASPQLLAMLILVGLALYQSLRASSFRFKHPFLIAIAFYGLFSSSLAPAVYTHSAWETGRYINILYFYFLVFAIGSFIYAEGWLIRRLESHEQTHLLEAAKNLGKRFSVGLLALVIALTALGGFEFTIMNTSSVSAIKSLVTGEAAQFHEEMMERQEYIRVTDSDVVDVKPLSVQPYVFKQDRLPFQGIYGRVRYMKWYFELFHNAQNEPAP